MRKQLLFCLCLCFSVLYAQQDTTVQTLQLTEVQVVASLKQETATNTAIADSVLNEQNIGQNLPYLLTQTPSLVVMSDDGLGIGYTYFRIRGTDHTRINMTVNDVPLNDQESQTVFWVNMTDMASSLRTLDVQRGVGTSTNGSAAFGASVNMSTLANKSTLEDAPSHRRKISENANVLLQFNGGMYGTFKEMLKAEVSLPHNLRLNARFSKVNSKGYLERAKSDLYSYHFDFGWYDRKTKLVFTAFGGGEKTYMAWDGVSKEQMEWNPRYNPAGEYTDKDGNIAYYPNQTDNYHQQHFQLHLKQYLTDYLSLSATAHYTHGGGYYEQMKADKKYSTYTQDAGLLNSLNQQRSNFIRQKWLNNHFYGGIVGFELHTTHVDGNLSAAVNNYEGDHYGRLTDDLYGVWFNHEYYRSKGRKLDANVYAKVNWHILNRNSERLSLYADLQYRHVDYRITGINDEDLSELDFRPKFDFFNPKAGLTYKNGGHLLYASFAMSNREPSRDNYTENGSHFEPKAERLFDYELGYTFTHRYFHIGANLYFMDYKNQLVLTGRMSDTGAALTQNVDKSYRMGVELMLGAKVKNWFEWNASLTVSRNKIIDFVDMLDTYTLDWEAADPENLQKEYRFGTTTIAFSPSVIFGNTFTFRYAGFQADIQTNVVSKQYLDNTENEEAVLKAYTYTNLSVSYLLPLPKRSPVEITLLGQANNIFNSHYAANGGNWQCRFSDGSTYCTPWYYVQAVVNLHAGLRVRF